MYENKLDCVLQKNRLHGSFTGSGMNGEKSISYYVTNNTGESTVNENPAFILNGISAPVSYRIGTTVSSISAVVNTYNSAYLNPESYPFSRTGYEFNKTINKSFDISKVIRNIRILGLMSIISYMIVILFVWMYANFGGYIYFLAGEPNLVIKYTEWVLGFAGVFVAIDLLHKELKKMV